MLLSPALKAVLAALDPSRDRLDLWLRSRRAANLNGGETPDAVK